MSDRANAKTAEFQAYIDQKQALLDGEATVFENMFNTLLLSNKTQAPMTDYQKELLTQKKALEAENYQLQQSIRAGRRRFMDADPQSGVANIGGIRTTDDKIALVFWIGYAFALLVGLYILLQLYGDTMGFETPKKKLAFGGIIFGLLCGIAYYSIYQYA